MHIHSVKELSGLKGRRFVDSTYRLFLKRPADAKGMQFYLDRLTSGVTKTEVISEIAHSVEARNLATSVSGQADVLAAVPAPASWWRRYVRSQPRRRILEGLRFQLELVEERATELERGLAYFGARTSDEAAVLGLAPSESSAPIAASGFAPRLGPASTQILSRLQS